MKIKPSYPDKNLAFNLPHLYWETEKRIAPRVWTRSFERLQEASSVKYIFKNRKEKPSSALGIAAGVRKDDRHLVDFLEYVFLTLDGDGKALTVIGDRLVGEDSPVVGVLAGEQVGSLPLGLELAENEVVICLVCVVKRIGLIHGKLLLPHYVAGGIGPANGFRRGRDAVGTAGQKKE